MFFRSVLLGFVFMLSSYTAEAMRIVVPATVEEALEAPHVCRAIKCSEVRDEGAGLTKTTFELQPALNSIATVECTHASSDPVLPESVEFTHPAGPLRGQLVYAQVRNDWGGWSLQTTRQWPVVTKEFSGALPQSCRAIVVCRTQARRDLASPAERRTWGCQQTPDGSGVEVSDEVRVDGFDTISWPSEVCLYYHPAGQLPPAPEESAAAAASPRITTPILPTRVRILALNRVRIAQELNTNWPGVRAECESRRARFGELHGNDMIAELVGDTPSFEYLFDLHVGEWDVSLEVVSRQPIVEDARFIVGDPVGPQDCSSRDSFRDSLTRGREASICYAVSLVQGDMRSPLKVKACRRIPKPTPPFVIEIQEAE